MVTSLNLFLPAIFMVLLQFEKYSTNNALFLHLVRCIFLRLASLLIALLSLLNAVECDYARLSDMSGDVYQACSNTKLEITQLAGNEKCHKPQCWETYVGQQFYKLTLIDVAVQILLVFILEVFRVKIIGFCWKSPLTNAKFNISQTGLDVIYSQTICWLGLYFSPLIAAVTVIKTFILFYVRKFYVLKVCLVQNITCPSNDYLPDMHNSGKSSLFSFKSICHLQMLIAVIIYMLHHRCWFLYWSCSAFNFLWTLQRCKV